MGHAALIVLSAVFLLPFVWLVATSLKADDDVMGDPTRLDVFVPKGRYIDVDGRRTRVVVSRTRLLQSAAIVVWEEGPEEGGRKLVRAHEIEDGRVAYWETGAGQPVRRRYRVNVEKEVPAGMDRPWVRVSAERGDTADGEEPWWTCVPETEVVTGLDLEFGNYVRGLRSRNFGRFFLTTVLVTVAGVFLAVLSCSFTAFGFSVMRWPGRDALFFLMLCTMMLPAAVTLIPVFMVFKGLGWINTYRPLVVPFLFGVPFFIFILRQFFLSIPRSLVDATRIDGCSNLRIWWQIVMPLSKPALMTVGLFSFLHVWNDFLGPLVYLTSERKYTLSVGLAMFQGEYGTDYGVLMAMTVVTILPILVLFFFAQRTFIQGVKLTGTKG